MRSPARSLPAAFVVAPLLAFPFLAGCKQEQATEAATPGFSLKQAEPTKVRTLPAIRQEMQRALETTTAVQAERFVAIVPLTTGVVAEVDADIGDVVKKGQLLARIDQREENAALAEAMILQQEAKDNAALAAVALRDADANIEKARLSMQQAKDNYERNKQAQIISALEIDRLRVAMEVAKQDHDAALLARDRSVIDERSSKTTIQRAELAIERAKIALSNTEMRAPFDGVLTTRTVVVGLNLRGQRAAGTGEGTAAFTIVDLSDLRATLMRPQRELSLFTGPAGASADNSRGYKDIEVTATTEALPGHTFRGEITIVSPDIDLTSGSFGVRIQMEEQSDLGGQMLPGMLLRMRLVTERHAQALTVPKRALRREGDTALLFVATEGVARRVEVEEGFSGEDYVEVTPTRGELTEGMQVVVVGNRDLEDGKPIQVSGWDDAEETEEEPAAEEAADAPEPVADSATTDASATEGTGAGDAGSE